jgi:hypothetical protein
MIAQFWLNSQWFEKSFAQFSRASAEFGGAFLFWGLTTNGHEWTLMFCCKGRFVACSIGAAVETQFANDFQR